MFFDIFHLALLNFSECPGQYSGPHKTTVAHNLHLEGRPIYSRICSNNVREEIMLEQNGEHRLVSACIFGCSPTQETGSVSTSDR